MPRLEHELTVRQAAQQRRSIRKYTDDPVPEGDLREIVRIASLAPSPWNVQPWRMVIVRDPDVKARLQVAANNQAQVGAAPVVFVLYSDVEDLVAHSDEVVHPLVPAERREHERQKFVKHLGAMATSRDRAAFAHGLTYIALGYLLLAAESLGYATSPMLGFKADAVKTLLAIPEHATIPALIAVGVANEPGRPSHRHSVGRIARFV